MPASPPDSLPLPARVLGDPDRPALLLLHGFLSSNLQWAPNEAGLLEHFRLVEVELWGHGAAPAPDDPETYAIERYVDAFEEIRKELGLEDWLVCGQSFGAGIVIRYALDRPDSVRGLVITNSRSALNTAAADDDAGDGERIDDWDAIDLRNLPYHPRHAKRFPTDLRERMERAAEAIPRHAIAHATAVTGPALSSRGRAHELRVPTLLVNGRFEKAFQADRDWAAATIPGIEVVDLDAGHSVNVEASDGFVDAVRRFAGEFDRR